MVLVVYAHPDPDSFTAALAAAASEALKSAGEEVHTVDLYSIDGALPFPSLMNVEELHRKTSLETLIQGQMRLLEESRTYVIVHPDWWGGPPAVLKGWVDRVFRPGTAYEIPEGFGLRKAAGLLKGRRAFVAISGDSESPGPLEAFWKDRVWGFCGVQSELLYLSGISESTRKEREEFKSELCRRITASLSDSGI